MMNVHLMGEGAQKDGNEYLILTTVKYAWTDSE